MIMTVYSQIDHAMALDAACRTDFVSFVAKCFNTLAPNAMFHPNWHIEAMAYHAELVRLGTVRRLIVNVPPRSLKSIVYSVALPAFILGHDPTKRVIVVSYGTELSTKHAIDFRAVTAGGCSRAPAPGPSMLGNQTGLARDISER
jgi:hypothetical protein